MFNYNQFGQQYYVNPEYEQDMATRMSYSNLAYQTNESLYKGTATMNNEYSIMGATYKNDESLVKRADYSSAPGNDLERHSIVNEGEAYEFENVEGPRNKINQIKVNHRGQHDDGQMIKPSNLSLP